MTDAERLRFNLQDRPDALRVLERVLDRLEAAKAVEEIARRLASSYPRSSYQDWKDLEERLAVCDELAKAAAA